MLTSVKMEDDEGCDQLDDYSFSILEGILPQVNILTMMLVVVVVIVEMMAILMFVMV